MRSQLLAGVALGALALSTATAQAGAGSRFGGYTAGIDLGYIDVQGEINDFGENFSNNSGYQDNNSGNGTLLGGRIGYDSQLDGGWLIGGELNVAMVSAEDSTCSDGNCADYNDGGGALGYTITSLASLRARLGYVCDPNGLVYVFGGFARARAETNTWDGSDSEDGRTRSFDGYTIGGGGQLGISPTTDLRLEIAYYDFEQLSFEDNDSNNVGVEPEAVSLSLGVVFHLN